MTSRPRWAETHLRYSFNSPELLELALTHRSAAKLNNERLEFLGDAFLNFTVAKRLYDLRVEDAEGDLSRARASLVNQSTLAEIGREIAIDTVLVLGRGELRSGGAQRGAILADAVEAVVGAVLLDGGYAPAERMIDILFADRFEQLPHTADLKDPKTKLQEWLQGRGLTLPAYTVDSVRGREHEQIFTVVCEVEEKQVKTMGRGHSRRHAEQQAAAEMLSELARERG